MPRAKGVLVFDTPVAAGCPSNGDLREELLDWQ